MGNPYFEAMFEEEEKQELLDRISKLEKEVANLKAIILTMSQEG